MNDATETAESTSFAEAFESSLDFKTPEKGDVLKGTIVSISGDHAYVAYGGPTEASIDAAEVSECEVGDTVEATVVATGPEVRISRKMLARRASIDTLFQAFESHLPVEGKVAARNKGGYDVNVSGLRAFCPLSQIDLGKINDPEAHIGQTYEFLILEMSPNGRKLVLSRAALIKEEAAARAREALEQLAPGAVMTGTVRNVVPFGAFVDLGGVEGLLHVSEMSRRRVENPKDVMKVGDEIEVKILSIENGGQRISLSRKDLEPDPWEHAGEQYQPGAGFTGTIARKADFGIFVELEPGLDGLVHRTQLPLGMNMNDPSLAVGSTVTGWVREVDPRRQRLSLALREVPEGDPWEDALTKYPTGRVLEGTVERGTEFGIFVEVEPGLTGLVPISELDLPRNADASSLHEPGETIPVKVLSVDQERKRMTLTTQTDMGADIPTSVRAEEDSRGGALALALQRALGKQD